MAIHVNKWWGTEPLVGTPPSKYAFNVAWAAKQRCQRKIQAIINYHRGLDTTPPKAPFEIGATCPMAPLIFVKECSPSSVAGDSHRNATVALIPI